MRTISPPNINKMVSRQVDRWVRREEQKRPQQESPCVTLSRLPGAGAAEVGLRVAEELGFGFFGLELVDQIARDSHVQRHLVAGLDERMRNAVERFVRDGVHKHEYDENQYHESLLRVLGTFAERGMAVILGRGAAYAIPAERNLRVLVVASDAYRIERLRAAKGLDEHAARAQLADEDTQRLHFNRHHFGVDPDDARLYDLVVNVESLGVKAAVDVIVLAHRERLEASNKMQSGRKVASPGAGTHAAAAPT